MKTKLITKTIAIVLASSILFQSCLGSWSLTNKLVEWNKSVTGNKFINNLIFWILSSWIGGITLFIDTCILNLIEFWTGSNPLAMKAGEREVQIVNKDGVNYEIVATKNRFNVTVLDGENAGKHTSLVYNDNTMVWSAENGTERVELGQVNYDNHGKIHILLPGLEGKVVDVKM
jgi:hypothetical protein